MTSYALIDSGNGRKLEQFGPFLISRPAAQAVWHPQFSELEWKKADAIFTRETENRWIRKEKLATNWVTEAAGIQFKISPTDFGHLGLFPEQRDFWDWIQTTITKAKKLGRKEVKVLNLFAYSGGSTLAAAKAGAMTCHLDASKGMVAWARENAALNHLAQAPIRWIVDDVSKFLMRELRRENRYDAIILDPPSFGRGSQGEVFKIEEDLPDLLNLCRQLLTPDPLFILFSCHTPGFTPITMGHMLNQMMKGLPGQIETGEMVLKGASPEVLPLPSGTYARWIYEK
jgi:23S rRNA (cytosine1962-C5)-methyltransferase